MNVSPALSVDPTQQTKHVDTPIRRWSWIESVTLAAYAAVAGLGIAGHEPWADEAQAWLMARDLGWWQLMAHAVRYEGSPGLWHSLLWLLARLHVGFTGIHWVAGAIAAAGVVVLLRWSPFPLMLRLLLPFGFWLAYQNAVVARSYVLFAVLAFSACAILRGIAHGEWGVTRGRLLWLALVFGLMANLSVHGFVASLGFALVTLSLIRRKKQHPVRIALPVAVLACFWAIAVATTFPPRDVNFPAGKNIERSTEKIWSRAGDCQAKTQLQERIWEDRSATADVRPGELAPIPPLVFHRTRGQALWRKIGRVLSLLTFPVSTFRWLALAVCVLAVAQALVFRTQPGALGWIGLLPWALMVLVFTSMYLAPRHAGMLWVALVAALWLTWPGEHPSASGALWLRRLTLAVLVLAALDQAWWTAHAVWSDVHEPYSGDVAMARFLKDHAAGKRVAGFYYHSIGVAGWFDRPVFFNQPRAYWLWSRNVRIDQAAPATIAAHPDLIVVGGWNWSPHNGNISDDWVPMDDLSELNRIPLSDEYRIIPYAEAHGYRETHRFCGRAFMRNGYSEELCQAALEPVQ